MKTSARTSRACKTSQIFIQLIYCLLIPQKFQRQQNAQGMPVLQLRHKMTETSRAAVITQYREPKQPTAMR